MAFWRLFVAFPTQFERQSGFMGCAFPGVSFQWGSVIGVPSVSLSVPCVTCQRLSIIGVPSVSLSGPSVFCSVLVGFPS